LSRGGRVHGWPVWPAVLLRPRDVQFHGAVALWRVSDRAAFASYQTRGDSDDALV
jgi:hypothetical protein